MTAPGASDRPTVRPPDRPLLFRLLPPRLRQLLYYARYCPPPARFRDLFAAAPLAYAPGLTMELVPTDVGHGCVALAGFVELDLTRRVAELGRAARGGLMVDVGANAGYFSLLWAAQHPDNRVIAFEASPRNVDRLRRNVARNGLGSRVRVEARAAGREAGTLEFDLGPEDQTGWGGFRGTGDWRLETAKPVGPASGAASAVPSPQFPVHVSVVRLDDILPPSDTISLLKIDTEGADTWVLQGAKALLRARRIGRIFYEQNKPRLAALGIGEGDAAAFLASVGYRARPHGDAGAGLVEWEAWV